MVKPKGSFYVSKNQLFYKFDKTNYWRQTLNLPNKKEFIGNWRLNKNHDLEFVLRKIKPNAEGGILRFKGEIVAVESDRLVFMITAKERNNIYRTQLFRLSGSWASDENNRLTFIVKKETEEEDILTLGGGWEVNDKQRIIYRYEKTDLKRRTKIEKTLVFMGFWDITDKSRLCFILEETRDSAFSFKAHLESPSLIGKEGVIKYRLGIGLSGKKLPLTRTIILFGAWKFGKKSELYFEMEYERGIFKSIAFIGSLQIAKRDVLILELKDRFGKDLDMKLLLEHKILKDEKAISLEFEKTKEEKKIEVGIKIPW
ncbi:MAG: hypothetical protein FJZ16_07030 [Candidatus Omnitrophica bacterium]|nr:hypothetical protein [Candidatus Omnitrophota bacterium]